MVLHGASEDSSMGFGKWLLQHNAAWVGELKLMY
jgi:hypothetical protein